MQKIKELHNLSSITAGLTDDERTIIKLVG